MEISKKEKWKIFLTSTGVGRRIEQQRIESRVVARDEGHHIANAAAPASKSQEWDAAWDSDKEDLETQNGNHLDSPRNKSSLDEERKASQVYTPLPDADSIDDAADAWGWADEDDDIETNVEPSNGGDDALKPQFTPQPMQPETRQMTLSEKYWITSLPQPVFNTVVDMFNDGASLTKPEVEHIPVTPAAPGLFALPILILAMYRAVAPHYYANEPGGNM